MNSIHISGQGGHRLGRSRRDAGGGLGLMVAEDALDQFFLKWVEARVRNRVYRASLRMMFNPGRTLGNLSTNQAPCYRKARPLTPR
jgi:hypothetical protein